MDVLLEMMESYGYLAMFFCMVAENANIPIPSEVVLGFAGFLISQNIFEFWTTFFIACLAGVTGSVVSYWLGPNQQERPGNGSDNGIYYKFYKRIPGDSGRK